MSAWVTFVLVIVGIFGQPGGTGRQLWFGWIAWGLVMLGLTLALLVDAKGWP